MKYSAVIVDDEIHCTESLRYLIEQENLELVVEGVFNDTKSAIDYLLKNQVDLVFLDIQMPGCNGFEMLNHWDQLPFDVVFVTAYDQYAIKAFTYSAINYLLKPVDPEELRQTIHKWQDGKNRTLKEDQLAIMKEILGKTSGVKTKVALPISDGLEFLEIQSIVRCESEGNYTRLYCKDESKHLICRTLKEVEKVLISNGFLRVHHSHLINSHFIRKFVRHNGGYIEMDDGTQISVSRTKKERLIEFFSNVEWL